MSADGTARQYVIAISDLLALAQTRISRTPEERATYAGEPLPSPTVSPLLSPTP